MKKNAFTLIELLAVIVILAIVALIATPIILGIIRDAKEQANKRSAENYTKAVNNSIVSSALDNKKIEDGEYNILGNGNICLGILVDNDCTGDILKVEIDGNFPTSGTIKINNGTVSNGTTINIGGTSYEIVSNELKKVTAEGPEHLAKENVRAVTTPTTGIVPSTDDDRNIVPGSEFKIKVSNDIKDENGNVVEYTFFVLSNDGNYVNLIAEQNITLDGKFTNESQDGDEWYITESNSYDNRYGPQKAYTYLSNATSKWTNVPIIENFNYIDEGNQSISTYGYQSIVTSLDSSTGKYITTITPLTDKPVTYENMRARLPKYSEVTTTEVGCNSIPNSCPLWLVNYLYNGTTGDYGYWLLSSTTDFYILSGAVNYNGFMSMPNTNDTFNGVRPVITILKSDLLRVMK